MELFFTAIALALVGGACWIYQYRYGSAATCRLPMSDWLSRYAMASELEQQEMAHLLLDRSLYLAGRMDVQIDAETLLPAGTDATHLIAGWQTQIYGDFNLAFLPTTPAQTLGALLLIRQAQPQRYAELMGESKISLTQNRS